MLTRRAMFGTAAAAAGASFASTSLAKLLIGETSARQLGVTPGDDVGAALNAAIALIAKQGTGVIRLEPGVYGTRVPIQLLSGVTLAGTAGATAPTVLRATGPIGVGGVKRSLIEQGEGASRCGLADLTLDCADQVSFAAWRAVAPRQTSCERVTMIGWTFGMHFTCTPTAGADGVEIADTVIRSGGTRQIYPVFLSSTVGGLPFRNVSIDGLEIIGSGGSYTPTNNATADQLTMQNVQGFMLKDIISRDGGENGISIVRGCRDGTMTNIEVTGADGQGCQIGGGGLVVTVDDPTSFAKGMDVTGTTSGAGGVVDLVSGNQVWIAQLKQRQFEEGEYLRCGSGGSRMTAPGFCRNIVIDGITARDNGRNVAGVKGQFADLYITQAEAITVRNASLNSASAVAAGLLVNNSRQVPCDMSGLRGNSGTTRKTGQNICG